MKLLRLYITTTVMLLVSMLAPASADTLKGEFLFRGWNIETGVHSVSYFDTTGKRQSVTAEELAAAGVDIWDQGRVFAHLNLASKSFGTCHASNRDVDNMGCFNDDGVAGQVSGPELDGPAY